MAEMISKWKVVSMLTDLENEFQHFKPFEGFEHAMYRKLCEVELKIGKTPCVTMPEWIPVTERLPDIFGVFIVAIHEPFAEELGTDSADFDPFTKEWLPSMGWDKGYKVTHWMPLPEPPHDA